MQKTKNNPLKRTFIVITLFLVIGLLTGLAYQQEQKQIALAKVRAAQQQISNEITQIQQDLDSLYPSLGGYPPQFESDAQGEQIKQKWKQTVEKAEQLLPTLTEQQQQITVHYQLGELYRLGHNLDEEGSWDKSEQHFKTVLNMDPKNVEAKNALGSLYVNSNIEFAPAAEKLFLSALEDATTNEQKVSLYQGLFFSRVYQFRIKEAIEAADQGLAIDPNNQNLQRLREIYLQRQKSR